MTVGFLIGIGLEVCCGSESEDCGKSWTLGLALCVIDLIPDVVLMCAFDGSFIEEVVCLIDNDDLKP